MKRGFSEANGFGGGTKKPPSTRYCFKLLCPDKLVKLLIGPKGATKDGIQADSGAKLVWSNQGEYFPQTQYRLMGVYADHFSAIQSALERVVPRINDCAKEEEQVHPRPNNPDFLGKEPGEYIIRCAISKAMMGELLGVGGQNIKDLRSETGCKIFVDNENINDHHLVRLIGGPPHVLANCLNRILDISGIVSDKEDLSEWGQILNFSEVEYVPDQKRRWGGGQRSRGDHGGDQGGDQDGADGDPNDWANDDSRAGELVDVLGSTVASLPEGAAKMEYSITFDLTKCRIDSLRANEQHLEVERATHTTIELPPPSEPTDGEEEDPYCTKPVSIVGELLNIYASHLMTMRKIADIERQEQADNLDDKSPEELKEMIRELQAQLAEAKKLGFVPNTEQYDAAR